MMGFFYFGTIENFNFEIEIRDPLSELEEEYADVIVEVEILMNKKLSTDHKLSNSDSQSTEENESSTKDELTPPDNQTVNPDDTKADTPVDTTNVSPPIIAQFPTPPVIGSLTTIDQLLTSGIWTGIAIAPNPDQIQGVDGTFYLDDFVDCSYYIEFFDDKTMHTKFTEYEMIIESHDYDTYEGYICATYVYNTDTYGYAFYLGDDNRLYMTIYIEDDNGNYNEYSDYLVFEQLGDVVNWQ